MSAISSYCIFTAFNTKTGYCFFGWEWDKEEDFSHPTLLQGQCWRCYERTFMGCAYQQEICVACSSSDICIVWSSISKLPKFLNLLVWKIANDVTGMAECKMAPFQKMCIYAVHVSIFSIFKEMDALTIRGQCYCSPVLTGGKPS